MHIDSNDLKKKFDLTPHQFDMLLAQHGLSAWRVARAMGIAPSTLSAWKLGANPPPLNFREMLEAAITKLTSKQRAA